MVRFAQERVLLIGDPYRQVQAALTEALPGAQVTSVPSFFDGVAELVANSYTAVVAAAEPIERRPEAAVRQLRELAGDGRVVLFGHPTLELLSRKMLEFGADDYLITPASSGEIGQIFLTPPVRRDTPMPILVEPAEAAPPLGSEAWLGSVSLSEIMLDALVNAPQDTIPAALKRLSTQFPDNVRVLYQPAGGPPVEVAPGASLLSHPVYANQREVGFVHLIIPDDVPAAGASRGALPHLASLFGKLATLQDRHNGLQKLAITDELTGLYNARYFRHFLAGIIERARKDHFPVTLLLFDIDDFKKYNDQFGHGVGDEILRQTAALMRNCTREHDRVCRIGGDEFAVVFWDKEGPRTPRDPRPAPGPYRPPQTPEQIFNRFKRMIADEKFPVLGPTGQGTLGISAGLAVFPYEAQDAATLVKEADNRLMHGAKKRGKNSLVIVGTDEPISPPDQARP